MAFAPTSHGLTVAPSERRVHHARGRPAAPDGAWAMRQAMEDALRCASFDDAGRLVLVRRLRITGLPAGAGGVLLTRALERAWRETARQAVPALSGPDAITAEEATHSVAVWFASPAEAVVAALARTVEGAPLAAWFWPLAVPALATTPAMAERVPALLAQLQALAPGSWQQALASWPLPRRARLDSLLGASEPGPPQATSWAARPTPSPARITSPEPPQPARAATVLPERTTLSSPQSVRGQAPPEVAQPSPPPSAPFAAVRAPPPPLALEAEGGSAESLAQDLSAAVTPQAPAPHPQQGASTPVPSVARVPATRQHPEALTTAAVPAPPPAQQAGTVPRQPRRAALSSSSSPSLPWLRDAVFSPHAGALWSVNLLQSVGFGAAEPSLGLVHAVLGGLFRTAGLHPDDPQWALLEPDEAPPPDRLAGRWQVRARRALRRHAGLSVAELVHRPGWITLTLTHADVVFPLDAVDLRARRRGLDCDPGYVPWLGRILRFHFVARADWPAPVPSDG